MYIPREYRETDTQKLVQFMREFSFATLVSVDADGAPVATHLPFVVKQDGDTVILVTHMSLGNQQKKVLGGEVLVIFQGPHAYISPANYESKATVPTWNYIAVHAYGNARITSFDEHDRVLRSMIEEYEPNYLPQYESLPADYKMPNMRGIVCVEITVTKLLAQYKLSQDKSHGDHARVMTSLASSGDPVKERLSEEMKLRSGSSE